MSPQLPSTPSLEHQRKIAKSLLKAQKQGDSSCCEILRHHEQLESLSDADILASAVTLAHVQHALAKSYRHKSWRALKSYIESLRGEGTSPSGEHLLPSAAPVDLAAKGMTYGLRYDPTKYVKRATGVDGELLGVFSFGNASAGDLELLASERKGPKVPYAEPHYLQKAEYSALLRVAGLNRNPFNAARDQALLATFLGTGARVSELAGANVKNLDLRGKRIRLLRKGGDTQSLPLSESVIE